MIRNVCIHVSNEQPLLADLYELPTAGDAGLVCTNVRAMDGKRPVFIDDVTSTFFFPYHVIRFLEIPVAEMATYRGRRKMAPATSADATDATDGLDDDDASAADLGGQAGTAGDGSLLPVAVGAPPDAVEDDPDVDLEIDEDFLQRIREI